MKTMTTSLSIQINILFDPILQDASCPQTRNLSIKTWGENRVFTIGNTGNIQSFPQKYRSPLLAWKLEEDRFSTNPHSGLASLPPRNTRGMSEPNVMVLAGHASFSTTHNFYLAVRTDLVDRARRAAGFWRALGARPEFDVQKVDSESGKLFNSRDLAHERP